MASTLPNTHSPQLPVRDESGLAPSAATAAGPFRKFRRLSIVGVLLACSGLGGARLFQEGPRRANAGAAMQTPAAASNMDLLSASSACERQVRQTLAESDKLIRQLHADPGKTQIALADLKTNPFRAAGAIGASDNSDNAAAPRNEEQERQEILAALQSVKLQSILRGDGHRACLINNALYLEGQEASGFVIQEIAAGTVVVRKGAYRFELTVSK